ncbi:MAG: DJ-1/PfpI family protein [Clostridia bacterium]|nr:DJ-1/PfpI family protein [Clostridia bacterium]
MVVLFLANGFEEIEALATVDVLRRAGLSVCTVGVGGDFVTGSHGITVKTDLGESDLPPLQEVQAVVLPGGLPGTNNLAQSSIVTDYVCRAADSGILVAAICAAPSVLGELGLLVGKRATCYPGYESALRGAVCCDESVVTDDGVVTAKGAGVSIPFALAIVARLISPEKAQEIGDAMQCR